MKTRNYIFILLAMLTFALAGCDKWDENGDLDGHWQLTEWRDQDGNIKATKQDMMFYSFQLKIASFKKNTEEQLYIRSSMEASSEQIRIYDPIEYAGGGHDAILPMAVLAPFGIPEDGILRVETLTGSTMVLTTSRRDVLTFRKY